MSRYRSKTPTYRSWEAMWRRTTVPGTRDWPFYGGKGITVDPCWTTFESFLSDMGERPDGTTLDRIDSTGNYTPENCRWATATTQLRNRSCVRRNMEIARAVRVRYAAGGISQRSLSQEMGIPPSIISRIITDQLWREEAV